MRNVEGGGEEHSRSVSLAAGVYCSTPRSRARTQYKPQSRSRVLRIRAARTWVNCSCASPRSALRATLAPAEPKGTRSAGPIGARGSEPRHLWRAREGASMLCEPDPAFTRARSSSSSSTCRRRRRLRRRLLRPRRTHHRRSKRLMGQTPAEERASTRELMVLPGPRTRLRCPSAA